jgi:hypothetical protein
MSSNRIEMASREMDAPQWPDREKQIELFTRLLGDAYAASVKRGIPLSFLYLGATSEEPTRGLVTQLVTSDPAEVLAAIVNLVKTGRGAGKIDDEDVRKLIVSLEEIVE